MKAAIKFFMAVVLLPMLATSPTFAGEKGTQPEAIAMVKKAVEYIKANGADKAYAEINSKSPSFADRDMYVTVYDMNGKCLSHGSNVKLVGKDLIDAQDADGVYYVKDRVTLAKTKASFWQDYKFSNPVTKKIEPKSTYCEKLNDTVICVGIYK
jgi:signal transduction histidine kinase